MEGIHIWILHSKQKSLLRYVYAMLKYSQKVCQFIECECVIEFEESLHVGDIQYQLEHITD